MPEPLPFLFFFAELILAYSAERAFEVLGKILKLGAGSDSVIGIACFFVINVSAYVAYILLHYNFLRNIIILYSVAFVKAMITDQSTREGAV